MTKLVRFLRFWVPPLLWALVIFILSSRPSGTATEIDWADFVVKKTAHVVFYAILATFIYRGLVSQGVRKREAGRLSIFLAAMYGVSDEVHQSFTPGRDPTLRDVIFDTIGASLAVYLIWKLLPNLPPKLKSLAKDFQLL